MTRYFLATALALTAGFAPADAQVIYSQRSLFDQSTGFVQAKTGSTWWRGSGVITRDSKLIYSCGHVFYDYGVWASTYRFHRAYHGSQSPSTSGGVTPRGFRYFTAYATESQRYGGRSARAYNYDFTVLYGNSSFGTAVGWWIDGGAVLRSNRWKKIVGYPSTVEYTGAPGYAYQHATEWFSKPATQVRDNYHHLDGVSTGSGNSGGPLFVWDSEDEDYHLGGILVSGDATLAGVYALNDSSNSMASNALGLEPVTRSFENKKTRYLPDGRRSYSKRTVKASGFSDTVTGLQFSTSIRTSRRGDLDVYLVSPTGRVHWISKHSKKKSNNLVRKNKNLTSSFRGVAANGKWKLKMRDIRKKKRAKFKRFSIKVTALGAD